MFVFLCLVFIQFKAYNQTRSQNAIYFELLGKGGLTSLNYDRFIFQKARFAISGRLGIGWLVTAITVPHHFTFCYGKKSHLEIGMGGMYFTGRELLGSGKVNSYALSPVLGYRLQGGNRIAFNVFASLLILMNDSTSSNSSNSKSVLPWGGIGIGYTFKSKKD